MKYQDVPDPSEHGEGLRHGAESLPCLRVRPVVVLACSEGSRVHDARRGDPFGDGTDAKAALGRDAREDEDENPETCARTQGGTAHRRALPSAFECRVIRGLDDPPVFG